MNLEEWIEDIYNKRFLCEEYYFLFKRAKSDKDIIDIVLDANGVFFLPKMARLGHPLPEDAIIPRFESYINGNYNPIYQSPMGGKFSSSIFCGFIGGIERLTTQMCILYSNCNIELTQWDYLKICSYNSNITLRGDGFATIYDYGNNTITNDGNTQIKIINDDRQL